MEFSHYTALTTTQLTKEFQTDSKSGLSFPQVALSRQKNGINSLQAKESQWWHILLRQFRSSFIYLLVVASIFSFILGERLDSLLIISFVAINSLLGFFQEFRSEKAVKLLRKYIVSKVKVIREGKELIIPSPEVVLGDLVSLEAGNAIPADIRFIKAENVTVDESILTGESLPVAKESGVSSLPVKEVYQAHNLGFSGTHLITGKALGIVIAIGRFSQMGKITNLAENTIRESVFEKETQKISKFIIKLVVITLVLVFLVNLILKGHPEGILDLVIFSIALAVTVIPEALPVVTTFSLSKGASDLAKNKVIVKRLSAIEDLGGIEVLCSDKTGTLTENILKLSEIHSPDKVKTLFYAALSSDSKKNISPFDLAVEDKLGIKDKELISRIERLDEMPFDPFRRRNSVLLDLKGSLEVVVRGAAEEIVSIVKDLPQEEKAKYLKWISDKGLEGKRVLAVAFKKVNNRSEYHARNETEGLSLLGLISFEDPIKKTVIETIKKAEKLGLKLKILTGDSKEVAGAVGYRVGLIESPYQVITGNKIETMDQKQLEEAVEKYFVFARLSPEQKFKIIKTLESLYEVGFLGEGINDVPALKAANVGIVVNDASDIAREFSDIILLKKSLGVIVDGIREGRMVFSNTNKYIRATLASNFGNFYAVALSTFFIPFLPMLPIQLLLLNLLSDFPLISVASDNVDQGELKIPSKLDFREFVYLCVILGFVSTVFDITIFQVFRGGGEGMLQTAWFMGSVLTELVFIYSIRTRKLFFLSRRPSWIIIGLTAFAALVSVGFPYTIIGTSVFKFISLNMYSLGTVFIIVLLYFISTETVKKIFYRFYRS